MTIEDEWTRLHETAASLVCRRNLDYMVDVHIVGRVADAQGAPVPGVGVYAHTPDQVPRDGSPRPLRRIGESASDGAFDLTFKYMWGRKVAWQHRREPSHAQFLLHFVHPAFGIAVRPVDTRGATGATGTVPHVVVETQLTLERLSEAEARVVQTLRSRSQYMKKRDPDPGDPGESWDSSKPWPHEAPFGGDTFTIGGDCGDQTQRIVDGVRWAYWQLRDGKIVTDPGLRVCIMEHMNSASVGCGGSSCNGAVNGYNDENLFCRSSHIVMCIPQIRSLSTPYIGRLAIHEWAHSCGWDHGDGRGVPGDSGVGLA